MMRPLPFSTEFKGRELRKIRVPVTNCPSAKSISAFEIIRVWLIFK